MGLIKAGAGSLGGTLADQWKEFFYCDALSPEVLAVKGQKRVSGRSSNTKGSDKTKQVRLENNIFFLNKTADVTITISPSIKFMKVEDDGFDDLGDVDGMVSVKDNVGLKDPALFKDVIDMKYLEAFLNATYSEEVDYDENSPMNQFRAALGLNKQGKITSKVSMFANPYPFDSAIKFFGAVQEAGAQKPLQERQ